MNDYLLTYTNANDGAKVYEWFEPADELQEFALENKDKIDVCEAIKIIDSEEVEY